MRMKRPPGLWILLSAGVLWLSLQDAYGIRATSLIFGKSTTSTTTEATSNASESSNHETATDTETPGNNTSSSNSTDPVLTGNPQIDYILDPNLPKELNGYNLSDYPFYERVPEEIDFKCDGLHDGFYASVPHKCQVYHHCLFGTRYDFLCANFTAFDQKTFICHFVSEVDCVNSKKFWHRNDALYQAQSTTTTGTPLRAAIYTPPPQADDPVTSGATAPRRPAGGGRRPYRPTRRRRPQFDYYEDDYYDDQYYDERPRSNRGRNRPRPRPRPLYDDEYEEYEDDRYESRRGGGRRRPYRRRNKDRRKPEYDDDEEVEERFQDKDFIAAYKRQKDEERRKRPVDDYDEPARDRKRQNDKRRPPSDSDSDRKSTRKNNRRPVNEDYDDEVASAEEERPRRRNKGNKEDNPDGRPIVKPATGTIYDRPRVAPRINLPVPKNAADKFSYKNAGGAAATSTTTQPPNEAEYEDEEYDEPSTKRQKNRDRRPQYDGKRDKTKNEEVKSAASFSRPRNRKPEVEETTEKVSNKPKVSLGRNRYRPSLVSTKKPANDEYYDDEEEYIDDDKEIQEYRSSTKNEKKSGSSVTTTTPSTTTSTTEASKKDPIMRIIKRPFLPSRGGNPYSPRGLQPVGTKAVDKSSDENDSKESYDDAASKSEESKDYVEENDKAQSVKEPPKAEEEIQNARRPPKAEEEIQNARRPFKPSPVIIKVPLRTKYLPPTGEADEVIDLEPSHQQSYKTRDSFAPRTTAKPKLIEKNPNPLDLNEYDVTLNDALNPTLPNLPVRAFPTGFNSGNEYTYTTFQRPRYVVDQGIGASTQNFVFQNKVVRTPQRFETVPQSQYRPQAQTQAIYSSY